MGAFWVLESAAVHKSTHLIWSLISPCNVHVYVYFYSINIHVPPCPLRWLLSEFRRHRWTCWSAPVADVTPRPPPLHHLWWRGWGARCWRRWVYPHSFFWWWGCECLSLWRRTGRVALLVTRMKRPWTTGYDTTGDENADDDDDARLGSPVTRQSSQQWFWQARWRELPPAAAGSPVSVPVVGPGWLWLFNMFTPHWAVILRTKWSWMMCNPQQPVLLLREWWSVPWQASRAHWLVEAMLVKQGWTQSGLLSGLLKWTTATCAHPVIICIENTLH